MKSKKHHYGEALRYQRDISGLSLTDLGKQVGTSSQNLGRWERGEVLPNIDFCVKLAEFYNISLNELLGLNEVATTKKDPQLTAEERELFERYRALNSANKKYLNQTIEILSDNPGGQKKFKRG